MRKYVAGIAVAAAAMLMVTPALAGAHAQTVTRAEKGKMDLLFLGKRAARRELYVQRIEPSTSSAGRELPGRRPLNQSYCTPPAEDNLFGAFSYDAGSTTFGSTNLRNCKALGYSV